MSDIRLPININKALRGRTVEGERLEFKKAWDPVFPSSRSTKPKSPYGNWG